MNCPIEGIFLSLLKHTIWILLSSGIFSYTVDTGRKAVWAWNWPFTCISCRS